MSEVFALSAADKAALVKQHPRVAGQGTLLAVGVPNGVSNSALEARLARVVDAFAVSSAVGGALEAAANQPGPATMRALLDREAAWRDIAERYGLLTASEIAGLAGSRSSNRSEYASAMRRDGRIVGVSRAGRMLFPAFQFRSDGRPIEAVRELVAALRVEAWSDESIILWCAAPNGYLDGAEPAALISSAPDRVLDSAMNAAAEW